MAQYHFELNSKTSWIGIILGLGILIMVVIFFAALIPIIIGIVVLSVLAGIVLRFFRKGKRASFEEEDPMIIDIQYEEAEEDYSEKEPPRLQP